jgi:hypothetical protein
VTQKKRPHESKIQTSDHRFENTCLFYTFLFTYRVSIFDLPVCINLVLSPQRRFILQHGYKTQAVTAQLHNLLMVLTDYRLGALINTMV